MTYRSTILAGFAGAAILLAGGVALHAHVTVVSPYTYNRDVAPILERRCAGCHESGGISWIQLETFEQVQTQSWSIRQSLISGRMPPWSGESGLAALKEPLNALTAREFNILMTWAAGGAPEGPAIPSGATPPAPAAPSDLTIEMPQRFVMDTGLTAADVDIVLPSGAVKGKWIRSFDIQARTPAIVHNAALLSKRRGVEQTIGLWIPGQPSLPLAGGGAFYVPPDGELLLRMHYRRPAASSTGISIDKSRVAISFADPTTAREVEAMDIGDQSYVLDRSVRAVALRPIDGPPDARLKVTVAGPDGSSTLTQVQLRPDWPQRYVFAEPVLLKEGSRIELTVEPWNSSLWQSLTGDVKRTDQGRPLRAVLEVLK